RHLETDEKSFAYTGRATVWAAIGTIARPIGFLFAAIQEKARNYEHDLRDMPSQSSPIVYFHRIGIKCNNRTNLWIDDRRKNTRLRVFFELFANNRPFGVNQWAQV